MSDDPLGEDVADFAIRAYARATIRAAFDLATRPHEGGPRAARALVDELEGYAAHIGLDAWNLLVATEARAYIESTGRCPYCGGPADHAPDDW